MKIPHVVLSYVRTLVKQKSGIVLDAKKEAMMCARLEGLARKEGFSTPDKLISEVRSNRRPDLLKKLINAMTTNETMFFRNARMFDALRRNVLPDLIKSREDRKQLNIWSAASSTGQEAYSTAIMLRESFPNVARHWKVRIVGTDINPEVVSKAKIGAYTDLEVGRGLAPTLRKKYFSQSGGMWKVSPELAGMVEFRRLNLMQGWSWTPRMDLVFMCNVLIYFDVEAKKRLLKNVRAGLADDGHLMLGTGESIVGLSDAFAPTRDASAGIFKVLTKDRKLAVGA